MDINNNQTDNPEQVIIGNEFADPVLQFRELANELGFGFKASERSTLLDKDGRLLAIFANSKPNRVIAIFSREQEPLWHARYEDLEDAELFVDDQLVIKGQTLMQFLDYAGDVVSFLPVVPANKIILGIKDLLIKLSPNIKGLRRINKTVYLRVKTSNQNIRPFKLNIVSEPMKIEEVYLAKISEFADYVESTIDSICADEKKRLMSIKGTAPVFIENYYETAHFNSPSPAPYSAPVEYQHQPGYQQLQSGSLREKFEQRQREKKEQPHPGDVWDQTF